MVTFYTEPVDNKRVLAALRLMRRNVKQTTIPDGPRAGEECTIIRNYALAAMLLDRAADHNRKILLLHRAGGRGLYVVREGPIKWPGQDWKVYYNHGYAVWGRIKYHGRWPYAALAPGLQKLWGMHMISVQSQIPGLNFWEYSEAFADTYKLIKEGEAWHAELPHSA